MSSMKRGQTYHRPAPMKHPCAAIVARVPRLVLEHVQRPRAALGAVSTLPCTQAATAPQQPGIQANGVAA